MGSIDSYSTAQGRRYKVRYRTPERRQTQKRGFTTKREAERFLNSVEVAKDRGEWVSPSLSRITIAEWGERWYEAQVHLKPTTLSGYRLALDKHVLPRWAAVRLSEISHGDIQAWVNKLSDGLAASTVRQTHLVLSGILKFAVRDGRLPRNPSDGVRLPRVTKKKRGYLTHEQVATLAGEMTAFGDLVLVLAYTGLRWGEVAGLRVERVDHDRRRLDIIEAVTEPRGKIIWGTPKSHERRSVPFPKFLADPFWRLTEGKAPRDLVFTGADGGVLHNSNFRARFFDPAVVAIQKTDPGFPRVTPHDLRHTAASLAISVGANVKAVQRMLGHSSAAMTLDVYADLFEDDLDAVAVGLDAVASDLHV